MISNFLNYVEIRTKITSVLTFLMTLAYLFYQKRQIDWKLTLLFFGSMFLFDLTTTAINNYVDTKTNGQALPFRRYTAKAIVFVLFVVSSVLGLSLAYLTDVVVLLLGGLCFLCGVLYSYGPIPISRQPLGEIFSGLFYGLLIPFILLYINMPKETYFSLAFDFQTIHLDLNIFPIISILLLSVAPVCATANIMLANNICDVEKDILVKRYTLPYYLGNKALFVFAGLYYITYFATVVMVCFRMLSPICLLSLLTIFPVQKNISQFMKNQDKAKTFVLSVKNFVILIGVNSLLILISGVFS
jgi:1,4-dihydroxy-2-naphthoate polyprenyltransferase